MRFPWLSNGLRVSICRPFGKEKTLHKGCSPANMISHIYNWGVLGSGLFSKWRYFTHWANASLEKDIDWFILVLHQLYKSSDSKN